MGQLPGLCERDQVLVPVQLPDDLVIAHLIEIKKIDLEPGFKGRTFSVYHIAMPINLQAIVEIFVSQ